jgi:hypothetical protein
VVRELPLRVALTRSEPLQERPLFAHSGRRPESASGGRARLFGISKRGDRYLRTLLIHGARSALGRVRYKQIQEACGVGKCGSGDTPILSLSRSPTRMRGSPGACLPATAEQERRRHHDMPIQPARVSVDDTASRAHRAAGVAESLLESRSVFAPPSGHATAAMSVFTHLAGAPGRRSRSFDPLEDPSWPLGKSDLLRHLSSRPWSRAAWRETCWRQSFRGRREYYRRRRPAPQGRGQGRRLDLTSCSVSHKVRRNTAIWKSASRILERSRCGPLQMEGGVNGSPHPEPTPMLRCSWANLSTGPITDGISTACQCRRSLIVAMRSDSFRAC